MFLENKNMVYFAANLIYKEKNQDRYICQPASFLILIQFVDYLGFYNLRNKITKYTKVFPDVIYNHKSKLNTNGH